jgi:predicted nucleic acid-binding protein
VAIEHGAEIVSADTYFARFTEVRWRNPLAG